MTQEREANAREIDYHAGSNQSLFCYCVIWLDRLALAAMLTFELIPASHKVGQSCNNNGGNGFDDVPVLIANRMVSLWQVAAESEAS